MDAIQNSPDFRPIPNLSTSPARAKVIAALARENNVTSAARGAGVDVSTIHRWLRTDPHFKAAVQSAQREYVGSLNDSLRRLSTRAAETIREVLEDPTAPAPTRLAAALVILQRPMTPSRRRKYLDLIESSEKQEQAFDKAA